MVGMIICTHDYYFFELICTIQYLGLLSNCCLWVSQYYLVLPTLTGSKVEEKALATILSLGNVMRVKDVQ